MVTVFLRGGLGNQMFQYAAGLNLARLHSTQLSLDTTFLNDRFPRRQFTYRTYDLDIFDFNPQFTLFSKVSERLPIPGVWLGCDLLNIAVQNLIGIKKLIKEKKEYSFDPSILSAGGNITLWGFWQAPQYFEKIENEIRATFHFKESFDGEALKIASLIGSTNSISLHVRRGDYLLPKYQSVYGETNSSYFEKAIDYITRRVSSPHFFIFSDDIAWCEQNIKPPFPTTYITRDSEGPKAAYHLELMSRCKHNIIANSSFSWWGAWLNQNPDKIVVAPRNWAHNSSDGTPFPSRWIVL